MKIFKSKFEKLLEKVEDKNKHLLNETILQDVHLLEKFLDWQEEYEETDLDEFLEYYIQCSRCGSYGDSPCICYAR